MKFLVLNGVSGVGKSTLAKHLIKSGDFHLVKSYTTRSKRSSGDVDHYFVDRETILNKINYGLVDAFGVIDDEWYCTTNDEYVESKVNVIILDDVSYVNYKRFLEHSTDCYVLGLRIKETVQFVDDERRERFKEHLPDYFFDLTVSNRDLKSVAELLIKQNKGGLLL